jgi:CBS domain-containing protein
MPPTEGVGVASILRVLSAIGRIKPPAPERVKTVRNVMSQMVIQVLPDTSLWKAASIMERRGVKRVPVVNDEGYLLGIVSRADLVKAMAKDDRGIAADVMEAINVLGEETIDSLKVEVEDGVATVSGVADRRSTHDLAIKFASRTPGVVEVIDRMKFGRDDTKIKLATNPDPDPRFNWQPRAAANEGSR